MEASFFAGKPPNLHNTHTRRRTTSLNTRDERPTNFTLCLTERHLLFSAAAKERVCTWQEDMLFLMLCLRKLSVHFQTSSARRWPTVALISTLMLLCAVCLWESRGCPIDFHYDTCLWIKETKKGELAEHKMTKVSMLQWWKQKSPYLIRGTKSKMPIWGKISQL